MRLIALISIAVLLSTLSACGKPVPRDKMAYVGDWRGDGTELSITEDGSVAYTHTQDGTRKSLDLPLKEFQGDNFVVGFGPLSTTFVVSQPPHPTGSDWKMTVDGLELTKVKE